MSATFRLWIGDDKQGRFIGKNDKAMDSLIYYYEDRNPIIRYSYRKLFLDNGAYTATRLSMKLDPERVKTIQECIDPDYTIPLDFPFLPGSPRLLMIKRWKATKVNIMEWQETTTLKGLIPMLHAWGVNSLIRNVKWLQKYADTTCVGLGSIVSHGFDEYRGFFGDRQPRKELVDMLITAVQVVHEYSDFEIHVAGFGSSPLMLNLGYYSGINSTDTTGYKRKAAFGKISLPGKSDRHIGREGATWGTQKLKKEERDLLRQCRCPICRKDQTLLWKHWKARAIHNKYVLQQEEKQAKMLINRGFDVYEGYINEIFNGSGIEYLWRYAKVRINYRPVDHWL